MPEIVVREMNWNWKMERKKRVENCWKCEDPNILLQENAQKKKKKMMMIVE